MAAVGHLVCQWLPESLAWSVVRRGVWSCHTLKPPLPHPHFCCPVLLPLSPPHWLSKMEMLHHTTAMIAAPHNINRNRSSPSLAAHKVSMAWVPTTGQWSSVPSFNVYCNKNKMIKTRDRINYLSSKTNCICQCARVFPYRSTWNVTESIILP